MNLKLFLAIHVIIYILIVFSPLFLSYKLQSKYGYLIAYVLYITILSWIVFGKCPSLDTAFELLT